MYRDYIELSWETPEDTKAVDINIYHVEMKVLTQGTKIAAGSYEPSLASGGTGYIKEDWKHCCSTMEEQVKISSLKDGNYLFRIAAETEAGLGDFAELTELVCIKKQGE